MKSSVIIVMGSPGSGKGTQAEILSDKFGLYYLESSKIIDAKLINIKEDDIEIVDGKEYSLFEEREKRHAGDIMSPELVSYWMTEKVKELAEDGKKMVVAGSPRTVYEAKKFMPLLSELYGKENISTIVIDLEEKEAIFRSAHRRICSLARHPILYFEETKDLTICPLDGSKLIIREDDNEEVIKRRMKEYRERTLPLLEYLKEEGYSVIEVKGRETPVELHKEILEKLG